MSMKQAAALMTPSTPARTSQGGSGWSATGKKVGTRLEEGVCSKRTAALPGRQ
jgi:hypothetical protein